MAPTSSNIPSVVPARRAQLNGQHAGDQLLFESCERRLVLSAQLLFDVLGDQAIDLHAAAAPAAAPPLELHLQEAHEASGLSAMRAEYGLTGAGQTVAVIDSGIAWDHVALGQGYGPGYRVVGGWDFAENDDQPYDDGPAGFHGTHVSGILGSNDVAQPGVAPGVDLVSLRVFNDMGEGRLEWIESALQWVQQHQRTFENPITTVNISIGTEWNSDNLPGWATLEDELQQLRADGILVTASAGNSFETRQPLGLSYPASSQYVLPVASVDLDGTLSDFSQRSERVLAAPGSNILSTVPDHVLGRDGIIDDFSTASGTSMAAPYVAGASVLVRQAMEMAGWEAINVDTITGHLHATADSVFDSTTGLSFDRLNLDRAIDALIPIDNVADTIDAATTIDLTQPRLDTWINSLGDTDVFRFQASADGLLTLDASSAWLDSLSWQIRLQDQTLTSGQLDPVSLQVVVGQTYELYVSGGSSIGPASFDLAFDAGPQSTGNLGSDSGIETPHAVTSDFGDVLYIERTLEAGRGYSARATQDGTLTVQWTNHDSDLGSLFVTDGAGNVHSSTAWSDGSVRLDIPVMAGEEIAISLPGSSTDDGQLVLANVLAQTGSTLTVTGTLEADHLALDLQAGVSVAFGAIEYQFEPGVINALHLNGYGSNDRLDVIGSPRLDKVDLRPTGSSLENEDIQVVIASIEEITYASGGGADRVYLYDSDTDDTLTARPRQAELIGVGYRFEVEQVERIFIHATGGGQDIAHLYDSAGDDRLSLRPQFSSLSGEGFFNYVRGFERVHAYANAGGVDTAELYDSAGDDRFFTSGVSASMVGPGFSSFTRSFEQVNAHAAAGGHDVANLYGSDAQTQWLQGSDFVSFQEAAWQREARGFAEVGTFVDGQRAPIVSPASVAASSEVDHSAGQTQPTPSASALVEPVTLEAGAADRYGITGNTAVQHLGSPDIQLHDTSHEATSSVSTWQTTEVNERGTLEEVEARPAPNFAADQTPTARAWETLGKHEAWADGLHLPEEHLLADEQLERDVLDEAFRQFEQQFR